MLQKIKKLAMNRRPSIQEEKSNNFEQSIRPRSQTHNAISNLNSGHPYSSLSFDICTSEIPHYSSTQNTVFHLNSPPNLDKNPPDLPPRFEYKFSKRSSTLNDSNRHRNSKEIWEMNSFKQFQENFHSTCSNEPSNNNNNFVNRKINISYELSTSETSLQRNFKLMSKCGWYWGPLRKDEAEAKLVLATDGTFLVRDSSDDCHLLTISFRSMGMTFHTRIEYWRGKFSIFPNCSEECYETVPEMISKAIQQSELGVWFYSRKQDNPTFTLPVFLSKPLSRFMLIRTLQHHCRFVIRQHTRLDKIKELPLPFRVKDFVSSSIF